MRKKYPIVKQEDNKDCGAACLAMIIKYYGGNIPYEELKDELEISKNGISASQLVRLAKKSGFEAKGLEGNLEELAEEKIFNFFCIFKNISTSFGKI